MSYKKKFLGNGGTRLVLSLFIEYKSVQDNDLAVYTLSKEDREFEGVLYPSLYRLYMETGDITEHKFVDKYLYDWKQWEQLKASSKVGSVIKEWQKELRNKVYSDMVNRLKEDALDKKSKTSTSSAKFLISLLKEEKNSKGKRGRPSNKTPIENPIKEDFERVFSTVK